MPSLRSRSLFIALLFFFALPQLASAAESSPVCASELMALVAGEVLPENVAHEIRTRGVQFRASDEYRAELKAAGAADSVLDALNGANFVASTRDAQEPSTESIKHLSKAGALLRARNFDAAIAELDATSGDSRPGPGTAFVLGATLVDMGDAEDAEPVFEELLRRNPEFPEVHTKLSYVFYALGDAQDGLSEARAALRAAPQNAEAHKNAGLNLNGMQNREAAIAEYHQALNAKSDYVLVRAELKKTLTALGRTREASEVDAPTTPKSASARPGSDQ